MQEDERVVYAMIFKGRSHEYCQVRGSMSEPGNWDTFKPVEFLALSSRLPDGKYDLGLLEGSQKDGPGMFRITVKDLALTKAEPMGHWPATLEVKMNGLPLDRPRSAAAKPSKDAIVERAQKLAHQAKRSAKTPRGKDKEHEMER